MQQTNYNKIHKGKRAHTSVVDEVVEAQQEGSIEEIKEVRVKVVKCGLLNVRQDRSTDSKVITTLPAGRIITATQNGNEWAYVPELKGYVMQKYIEVVNNG